jgi:hypothetical protein
MMNDDFFQRVCAALALTIVFITHAAWARDSHAPDGKDLSTCADVPHGDHPKALLSNGSLHALVFLPDAKNGYYRASRFDWSGVVGCVSYQGHTFFGEWFSRYDPLLNDSITGPVEEFRSKDGAIGYSEASPGELFVKPGVGVLRKVDDSPYKFGFPYPIVDTGKWTVRVKARSVSFRQQLTGPRGIAYIYEKKLELDKHGSVMTLEHRLKNVGQKTIDTDVYDHDFYMLDGRPTGPGMVIRFPFEPKPDVPLGAAVSIEGKEIVYVDELKQGQTVAGYLKGYSDNAADYDFTVEDRNTKIGVEQWSDNPISRFYLWSIHRTLSPEAYIHLNIPPGKTGRWKIHYRFFAPPSLSVR